MSRLPEVDFIKGLATITMIIFHVFYMSSQMNLKQFDFDKGILLSFARFAQIVFITTIGINLALSYQSNKNDTSKFHHKQTKRSLVLGTIASIITITTMYIFPDKYVKFGIMHFAAISIFMYQWITFSEPLVALSVVGILVLNFMRPILIPFFHRFVHPMLSFILGIYNLKYNSIDHFSLIPYAAIIGIGILIGKQLYKNMKRRYKQMNIMDDLLNSGNKTIDLIKWIGQNSLLIYVIHYPIIYFILKKIKDSMVKIDINDNLQVIA